MTTESIIIATAYFIILIFVALWARKSTDLTDFTVASRQIPTWLLFTSVSATFIGPGFTMGFVGRGYETGFLFLIMGSAYALQTFLVGALVSPRIRSYIHCLSLGDIFGEMYGKWGRLIVGVLSVGLCAGFAAVMAKAGGVLFEDMLGIPEIVGVIIVVGLTVIYSAFGGLRASIITDAYQFFTFTILFVILAFYALLLIGSADLSLIDFATDLTKEGFKNERTVSIASLFFAFLLGETLIPPYVTRALGAKGEKEARKGFIYSGFFAVFWFFIVLLLGILARIYLGSGIPEDNIILEFSRSLLPVSLQTLVAVVLLGVIMSSLDSLLNAGAASASRDFRRESTKLNTKEDRWLLIGRLATVFIALIAVLGAYVIPAILDGLILCYTVWAPAILPAFVFGLLLKKTFAVAGLTSIIVGSLSAITLEFGIIFELMEIPSLITALIISIASYLIIHFIYIYKSN